MAAYNTSSAYDLSIYEGTAAKSRQQRPQLQVVQKRSAKRTLSSAFTPKALSSFAIVVTLICLMVYNQVCLNELTGEINELKSDITVLESEYVKISSELDAMISLRTVGDRARDELGMNRLDKYQTEYVLLYEGDQINIKESAPNSGIGSGVKMSARSFMNGILEYLG